MSVPWLAKIPETFYSHRYLLQTILFHNMPPPPDISTEINSKLQKLLDSLFGQNNVESGFDSEEGA
jgi:hypothetical protein